MHMVKNIANRKIVWLWPFSLAIIVRLKQLLKNLAILEPEQISSLKNRCNTMIIIVEFCHRCWWNNRPIKIEEYAVKYDLKIALKWRGIQVLTYVIRHLHFDEDFP